MIASAARSAGFSAAGHRRNSSTASGCAARKAAIRSASSLAGTAAQSAGITTNTADQWRRATAQATLGLGWDESAPATLQVAGPAGVHAGGKPLTFTITGAAPGERVCVEDTRSGHAALVGNGGALTYTTRSGRQGPDLMVKATTGPGCGSRNRS